MDTAVERVLNLHIEKLLEGVYLATSVDVPGLVAQGRTITETLEVARDVAKKIWFNETTRLHDDSQPSGRPAGGDAARDPAAGGGSLKSAAPPTPAARSAPAGP